MGRRRHAWDRQLRNCNGRTRSNRPPLADRSGFQPLSATGWPCGHALCLDRRCGRDCLGNSNRTYAATPFADYADAAPGAFGSRRCDGGKFWPTHGGADCRRCCPWCFLGHDRHIGIATRTSKQGGACNLDYFRRRVCRQRLGRSSRQLFGCGPRLASRIWLHSRPRSSRCRVDLVDDSAHQTHRERGNSGHGQSASQQPLSAHLRRNPSFDHCAFHGVHLYRTFPWRNGPHLHRKDPNSTVRIRCRGIACQRADRRAYRSSAEVDPDPFSRFRLSGAADTVGWRIVPYHLGNERCTDPVGRSHCGGTRRAANVDTQRSGCRCSSRLSYLCRSFQRRHWSWSDNRPGPILQIRALP